MKVFMPCRHAETRRVPLVSAFSQNGFTLIELLVVVLIIGILSAVALPQYQKAVAKSRYIQLMTAGDAIWRAEEIFYLANGHYTNNLEDLDIQFPASSEFSLALDVRADGHAAINAVASRWALGHIVYFDHHPSGGKRECRVYPAGEKDYLHQVCKSLSGASSGNAAGSYTAYVFQ